MNISWKNIIAGDKAAYSEAYLLLYERFYNYGLKFTADATLVEDAIQEVLLSIWLNRDRLSSINNPQGYFFSSFRNSLMGKLKSQSKQVLINTEHLEPEFARDTILINQELSRELQQRLQTALQTLTSRQREAIFLRFYEGLSYEEVAEALGITVKATYKIMARALLELKEKMALPVAVILLLLQHGD